MPGFEHHWTAYNPYQAPGTQAWAWRVGEGQHYWGYSVRPFQHNSDCEVLQQWTTSDNDGAWSENFVIRTNSGGLLRFSALAAIGS